MALGEQAHDVVLREVRVLVFVDQNILEAGAVAFEHVRTGGKQLENEEQQVVKIDRVAFLQLLLIQPERVDDLARFVPIAQVLLRVLGAVLCVGDL
ncbi:MAG: hypothetical protein BWY35_02382 [Firmicutes bacterium ADurb.Bin248]|nr:MAG: hypothetical protein BWY35_02382 [Firmicutes bacterium ADurb.Bin248]